MGSLYRCEMGRVYLITTNIDKEDIVDYLINANLISNIKSYSINPVIDISGLTFHCILDNDWSPFYYSELPYEEAVATIEEDGILFDW